jgi:hypothetical protein
MTVYTIYESIFKHTTNKWTSYVLEFSGEWDSTYRRHQVATEQPFLIMGPTSSVCVVWCSPYSFKIILVAVSLWRFQVQPMANRKSFYSNKIIDEQKSMKYCQWIAPSVLSRSKLILICVAESPVIPRKRSKERKIRMPEKWLPIGFQGLFG